MGAIPVVKRFPQVLGDDVTRMATVHDVIQHLALCGIREIPYPAYQALRLFGAQWIANFEATTDARNNQPEAVVDQDTNMEVAN